MSLHRLAALAARLLLAPLLAAFFAFVGFMKAWAPMAELARHHAWVTSLPVIPARLVGVSELICAAALLGAFFPGRARQAARLSAWALIVNQAAAFAFHLARAEGAHALAQNLLLVAMLAALGSACRAPAAPGPV